MERHEAGGVNPRWSAAWNLLMVVLAVASFGVILWVELEGIAWPDPRFQVLAVVDLFFVLLFLGDFLVGWARAEDRKGWWKKHWYELPGLVPLYFEAFAFLRIAQVLRLARVLRLLRALTALRRLRGLAFVDVLINRNKLGHTLVISAAVVLSLASVVWLLERDTNPALSHFGDALWWAIVTTTTVGYGDITPQTGLARLVATVLMLMGIGLIGVVASSISTAIIAVGGASPEDAPAQQPGLAAELERLAALKERGHLTDEEFSAAKRKLLS
ncbi:ion transporter [Archangium violaceum]|uniref:ion transporter n=1 Tax=Archangium violaceum TaxID=83451 RepID=UPI00193BE602|nr:ion transporter [Archangium violaceum]QRK09407.1 ion transporter [Archangium violaceum]